jgi:hypothetical protein
MSEQEDVKQEESQQQDVQESKTFTEAELQELVNKEVEGLKNKNNELLGKLKDFQSTTEQIKTEAEKAKEEALKKSGDIEEYKKFADEKIAKIEQEYKDQLAALDGQIKQGQKQEIINKLVGDFVDSVSASFMLNNLVDVEDGNQKFKDFADNIVADNVEDYRKWIKTNPHMAHFVQGTKATGGDATGGKAASAQKSEITKSEWASYSAEKKMQVAKELGKKGIALDSVLVNDK